jgi:hypothetical protein
MYKTGVGYFEDKIYELVLKSIYTVFVYAVIAYRTEIRTKQSFLGRISSDKAFHRWLKIFETFPEGIALIRNNTVLYSNSSLKRILELDYMIEDNDPLHKQLKKGLSDAKITAYTNNKIEKSKD